MFKDGCGQNVYISSVQKRSSIQIHAKELHFILHDTKDVLSMAKLSWNLASPSGRLVTWQEDQCTECRSLAHDSVSCEHPLKNIYKDF